MIWRPIMAGKVTLPDVKSGAVSLMDLLKINAILDAQDAQERAEMERNK